ncbi:MAG: hypothetical protein RL272_59 [Candidatus Parcubacteria bacterium]|jgi:hypothetical protein
MSKRKPTRTSIMRFPLSYSYRQKTRPIPSPSRAKLYSVLSAALLAAPTLCSAFTGDPLHPLGTVTIQTIIGRIIAAILGLLGSISLAMFVYGGMTWMLAQGNEEKIKKAKNTIVYAVFGLIIAFSAYEILRFFMNSLLRPAIFRAPPSS